MISNIIAQIFYFNSRYPLMYPDVQNMVPETKFKITRVGVKNVVKPIHVRREKKDITLITNIDIFVD